MTQINNYNSNFSIINKLTKTFVNAITSGYNYFGSLIFLIHILVTVVIHHIYHHNIVLYFSVAFLFIFYLIIRFQYGENDQDTNSAINEKVVNQQK